MKRENFWLRFIIFFIISSAIVWGGYYGFFVNNQTDIAGKFSFLYNLSLLGIFVSTLVLAINKKIDLRNWNDKEFLIYGFFCFFGSLMMILFIGLQGFNFNFNINNPQLKDWVIQVGNIGTTFGIWILFTSLTGMLVITFFKIIEISRKK